MTTAVSAPPTTATRPQSGTRPRQAPARHSPSSGNGQVAAPRTSAQVQFGAIAGESGHRVVIYGPGGIGKTSLATAAPGPVVFFDLDDSLPRLAGQLPEDAEVRLVAPGAESNWESIRSALHAGGWDAVKTIVIDSATRAEELAVAWTIANVPHEKRDVVIRRIEDYGFGKGYQHVYDTFLTLLGDLDQHARAGRHVVLICHDCTSTVPNPSGDDWLRYEPRLQTTNSGKASVRLRVKEWADHLLFVGYDVDVQDGKGRGSGTRTIYPTERPHCMAKSRTLADPIVYERHDRELWNQLLRRRS